MCVTLISTRNKHSEEIHPSKNLQKKCAKKCTKNYKKKTKENFKKNITKGSQTSKGK